MRIELGLKGLKGSRRRLLFFASGKKKSQGGEACRENFRLNRIHGNSICRMVFFMKKLVFLRSKAEKVDYHLTNGLFHSIIKKQ